MPLSWGRTFVTLIPQNDSQQLVTDFYPISLCNVSYKVITKILANHLKNVISKLVGHEQSAFLVGRSTFDNIIAAQEIAHSLEFDYLSLYDDGKN